MAIAVPRFKNMTVPAQQGELARLRVIGGPDVGTVFVLTKARITLGRGEENDVVFTDLNMSRRHSEIVIQNTQAGFSATIFDSGSANGTVVNGVVVKQNPLKTGDKIGFGKTVVEFLGSDAEGKKLLALVPATRADVGTGLSGLTGFIQKMGSKSQTTSALGWGGGAGVSGAGQPSAGPPTAGEKQSFLERNKRLVLLLGGLIAIATLLPTVEQKQKAKKRKFEEPKEVLAERNPSQVQPPEVIEAMMQKADRFYHEGFREFRAQNYTRALAAFQTALQIYAEHSLAKIYLESTKKEMEKEAKEHFKIAKRDEEANRLKGAKGHYEAVKRLYVRDQNHALYKEAENYATELEKRIKDSKRVR